MTCEVYLSTPPVGYSGSPSTVNETNCNKERFELLEKTMLTSNSIQTCPTTMRLKKDTIVFVDIDGDALQLVLLTRGGNGFCERQQLENRIEASWAHLCLICSRWDTIVLGIFSFPLEWDDMHGLLLQVRPTLCTFVLSIRLRVVIHDKLDLLGSDREYL